MYGKNCFGDYSLKLLQGVKRPSRYLGKEPFYLLKDWDKVSLRICFIYPDLYEVGRSHLGIKVLTALINAHRNYLCDLAFALAPDMEEALSSAGLPLLSTNYRRPLGHFDVLGFSLAYELLATNVLQILALSNLPFKAEDRDKNFPVILGGGPAVGNPEPLAEVFDAILIGEGEEAILEILDVISAWKKEGQDKQELYKELVRIPGVYVPLLKNFVQRRIFTGVSELKIPILKGIPTIELSHDRLSVEIARGCTRGCRFCEAGFYYRPVREKPPELILQEILEGFRETGYREASLMSLSAGDYTQLEELVFLLDKTFYPKERGEYAFSLPSLRVGSLTRNLLRFLKKGRTTTLTFAIEAGSERLRRVINKDINLEEFFQDLALAQRYGFRRIKVYFMIGLPTEREEDLAEMVKLYQEIKKIFPSYDLTFSASIFIPKPHTPFQWVPQLSLWEAKERLAYLKGKLKRGFRHHDPEQSFLEGVLARGGRELFSLIHRVFQKGARLDPWSDYFSFNLWQEASEELGLNLEDYLRERAFSDPLPWDHIDLRVKKEFLWQELERAKKGKITKDCRFHRCVKCGVCKGEVKNQLASQGLVKERPIPLPETSPNYKGEFWYLLRYTKLERAVYLSQLEVLRLFELVLRRYGFPLSYTQGFNPRPKFITTSALPVGVASTCEVLAVCLLGPNWAKKLLGREIYEGLRIDDILGVSQERPKLKITEVRYRLKPLKGGLELVPLEREEVKCQQVNGDWLLVVKKPDFSLLKFLKDLLKEEEVLKKLMVLKEWQQIG